MFERRKILIFGDYGSGKSIFAATSMFAENYAEPFIIDAEEGSIGIEHILKKKPPFVYKVKTLKDIDDAIRWLEKREQAQRYYEEAKSEEEKKKYFDILLLQEEKLRGHKVEKPTFFRTVIYDSYTKFQTVAMSEITNEDDTRLDHRSLKRKEYEHWGKNLTMMQNLTRLAFNLQTMNFIGIALSQSVDPMDELSQKIPSFNGKYRFSIGAEFDIVAYMSQKVDTKGNILGKGKLYRVLNFGDQTEAKVKNRFIPLENVSEGLILNPTIQKLEELIASQLNNSK